MHLAGVNDKRREEEEQCNRRMILLASKHCTGFQISTYIKRTPATFVKNGYNATNFSNKILSNNDHDPNAER